MRIRPVDRHMDDDFVPFGLATVPKGGYPARPPSGFQDFHHVLLKCMTISRMLTSESVQLEPPSAALF